MYRATIRGVEHRIISSARVQLSVMREIIVLIRFQVQQVQYPYNWARRCSAHWLTLQTVDC